MTDIYANSLPSAVIAYIAHPSPAHFARIQQRVAAVYGHGGDPAAMAEHLVARQRQLGAVQLVDPLELDPHAYGFAPRPPGALDPTRA